MLSSVLTTLMILAIIVAWSARGNIATWLEDNPSADERGERIERGRESDMKIEKALSVDLQITNADRVSIRQFTEFSNVPYVTTTHLVTSAGVGTPILGISTPRAYISDITNIIYADPKHPKCIREATRLIQDKAYSSYLKENGVYEFYVCPIEDLDGNPIGIIGAEYLTSTKERPTEEEIFAILKDTGTRVAGYLAEVTAPEKKVWYRQLLAL